MLASVSLICLFADQIFPHKKQCAPGSNGCANAKLRPPIRNPEIIKYLEGTVEGMAVLTHWPAILFSLQIILFTVDGQLGVPDAISAAKNRQQYREKYRGIYRLEDAIRRFPGIGLQAGGLRAFFRTDMCLVAKGLLTALPTQRLATAFAVNHGLFGWMTEAIHLTRICRRACAILCAAGFSSYSLHRELMKADLRISIKDCQHNENLEIQARPVRPMTSGVCLGSGQSSSS
jgi:hypothetical protein